MFHYTEDVTNSSLGEEGNQRWEFLVGDPLPEPVNERVEAAYSAAERKERAEARKGVFEQIASVEGAADSGDVVMTATCAALVKDTWLVEPADDGAHRLKGLIVPGLGSAQRLVARSKQIKGFRDESQKQSAGSDIAAIRAAAAASAAKVASRTLTPVTKGETSAATSGDRPSGLSPASSSTSTTGGSTSPTVTKPATATDAKPEEEALHLQLPLLRDIKTLGATGGAAAVRSIRMHIPNPVRLRIEAGHQDFVNETRVCTCMFVGFTRMSSTTASANGGVAAVASATATALEGCVKVLQDQVHKFGGTLLQVRCDEKGYLAICAWGLPGRTHKVGWYHVLAVHSVKRSV